MGLSNQTEGKEKALVFPDWFEKGPMVIAFLFSKSSYFETQNEFVC